MANCQFKIIRENSIIGTRKKETHARIIQKNPKGGPLIMRLINFSLNSDPIIIPFEDVSKLNCDLEREYSP